MTTGVILAHRKSPRASLAISVLCAIGATLIALAIPNLKHHRLPPEWWIPMLIAGAGLSLFSLWNGSAVWKAEPLPPGWARALYDAGITDVYWGAFLHRNGQNLYVPERFSLLSGDELVSMALQVQPRNYWAAAAGFGLWIFVTLLAASIFDDPYWSDAVRIAGYAALWVWLLGKYPSTPKNSTVSG